MCSAIEGNDLNDFQGPSAPYRLVKDDGGLTGSSDIRYTGLQCEKRLLT